MTFEQKIAAYILGLLKENDLPDIALTGLEEGKDSLSLRMLAGLSPTSNPFELETYFKNAVSELNVKLQEKKEALISIIAYYARIIVESNTDTYNRFSKLNEIIGSTEFSYDDIGLMYCYGDYISIWEEKTGGLDFHTTEGLSKEQYIEKTELNMRKVLENWLFVNDCNV